MTNFTKHLPLPAGSAQKAAKEKKETPTKKQEGGGRGRGNGNHNQGRGRFGRGANRRVNAVRNTQIVALTQKVQQMAEWVEYPQVSR